MKNLIATCRSVVATAAFASLATLSSMDQKQTFNQDKIENQIKLTQQDDSQGFSRLKTNQINIISSFLRTADMLNLARTSRRNFALVYSCEFYQNEYEKITSDPRYKDKEGQELSWRDSFLIEGAKEKIRPNTEEETYSELSLFFKSKIGENLFSDYVDFKEQKITKNSLSLCISSYIKQQDIFSIEMFFKISTKIFPYIYFLQKVDPFILQCGEILINNNRLHTVCLEAYDFPVLAFSIFESLIQGNEREDQLIKGLENALYSKIENIPGFEDQLLSLSGSDDKNIKGIASYLIAFNEVHSSIKIDFNKAKFYLDMSIECGFEKAKDELKNLKKTYSDFGNNPPLYAL
jgi:hypothetical protein